MSHFSQISEITFSRSANTVSYQSSDMTSPIVPGSYTLKIIMHYGSPAQTSTQEIAMNLIDPCPDSTLSLGTDPFLTTATYTHYVEDS